MASPPPPSASQHVCLVCGDDGRTTFNYGARTCASCREFFRRRHGTDLGPCKREGNCSINQHTRGTCPPCRLQKCQVIGMRLRAQAEPTQHPTDQQGPPAAPPCFACNLVNDRKQTRTCAACQRQAHLSCIGLTRVQSNTLPVWHCADCVRPLLLAGPVGDPPPNQDSTPTDLAATLADLKRRTRVPKRILRRKRHQVASELADLITSATEQNTATTWWRLLSFAYTSLGSPVHNSTPATTNTTRSHPTEDNRTEANNDALARLITSKCADGDIRSALRLLTTPDTVAPPDEGVIEELKAKHPPAPPDEDLQHFFRDQNTPTPFEFSEAEVLAAIQSMPRGSSAGLDGIRPLHLQQLTTKQTAEAGSRLLSALTALCHHAAAGHIPDAARNAFFGASLIAIKKKQGGLRPIAIGSSYRRLTGRLVAKRTTASLSSQLTPTQLGVGAPLGCEAAVHAVRKYTHTNRGNDELIVKVDLSNAFNSVTREVVLSQVSQRCPSALPLVRQAYAQPTPLFISDCAIWSCRGVQQGDPLGPLLFALAIDPIIQNLRSPLNIWYLDDGTLAGPADSVTADISTLLPSLQRIGLTVNCQKCELTRLDDTQAAANINIPALPDAHTVPLHSLSLLGAPIHTEGLTDALEDATQSSRRMIERVDGISSHLAFFLLSRYSVVPRCTYLMRAAPTYLAPEILRRIDDTIRTAISSICNIDLPEESWIQASLPTRLGGIGIRRTEDVALPAFISSMSATQELVGQITSRSNDDGPTLLAPALTAFIDLIRPQDAQDFSAESPLQQRQLDEAASRKRLDTLLGESNQIHRARLLAAAEPHSGAWLDALPAEKLGLLLPDEAIRVGVALRLGIPVCLPHRCKCGAMADNLGHHQLSCPRDPGRLPRHAAINDIIRRGLAAAGVPALLEPRGLDRGDGRRPDGITITPFSRGRSLVWDATCSNTFSSTHVTACAVTPGAAARAAEQRKQARYAALVQRYRFEPLAVETTGVLGPAISKFLAELGRRITAQTGEKRETCWLRQRISLAIVRGNAAAITVPAADP